MIEWRDLLGVPFLLGGDELATGIDCWGQAREVNRRAGRALPDLSRTRPSPEDAERGLVGLVPVRPPYEVGDVFMSDPEGRGYPSHVAVLVEPGWTISCTQRHGPYARREAVTPRDLGVWRAPRA